MNTDVAGTFPSERVIHDDRNAIARGVHALVEGSQCSRGNLIGGPAHDVVVLLRVFIDDADAGAGSQIVELVEQNFLPVFCEFARGIFIAV